MKTDSQFNSQNILFDKLEDTNQLINNNVNGLFGKLCHDGGVTLVDRRCGSLYRHWATHVLTCLYRFGMNVWRQSLCTRVMVGMLCLQVQAIYAAMPSTQVDSSLQQDDTAMPARRALLSDEDTAFQWGIHIDSDLIDVLHGGLRHGSVGNNVIHIAVAMDTDKLGLWSGGRIVASALRIQGEEASANRIGDLQGANNLDAPAGARLYQFWYRQRFQVSAHGAKYSVRGGLIDLNQNFAATDAASILLNASFGLNPTLSANVPVSTYPQPGFGIEGKVRWLHWQTHLGIFQADPKQRNAGFKPGNLLIGQVDYQLGSARAASTLSLGVWRYRQHDPALGAYPQRDWGGYASIDMVLSDSANAAHAFVQIGHAPDASNRVPNFLGLGVQLPSPLAHRPNDLLTAGIAHAQIRNSTAGSETSYEVSYLFNVYHYLTLQPDLQYIRHPAGRNDITDALVAMVRLHLEFY